MYINASSGIIYPDADADANLRGNIVGSNAKNKLQDYVNKNTGNGEVSSGGLIFGNSGAEDSGSSRNESNSIDRSGDYTLQEDTEKVLQEYRKRLDEWKKQKNSNSSLINNLGLDMNGVSISKRDSNEKKDNRKNYKSFKDVQKIIDMKKMKSDSSSFNGHQDDMELNFQKTADRQKGNNGTDRDWLTENVSDRNENTRRGSLDKRSSEGNNQKVSSNRKDKEGNKDKRKARSDGGEKLRSVTKASIEASSGIIAKALILVVGLFSAFFKQDILFRLILGIFLGVTFIALVLAG